ncbi:Uncharacterised protein [uncultured archaeon]|nr:Uncharacterised protein [uncultured archaeon]
MAECFSAIDLQEIRRHAHNLITRGYFTGFNIVRSSKSLPSAAIMLHFLHDAQDQIDYITRTSGLVGFQVLPRETAYLFDLIYAKKKDFEKEYKNAVFIGTDGSQIPLSEVGNQKTAPLVVSDELDLMATLDVQTLEQIVMKLESANRSGPQPWIHPVIIVKSVSPLDRIPGFVDRIKYVCISKNNEEAYALVEDDKCLSLQKYVDKFVCVQDLGKTRSNIVVFHPSQINQKFFEYMLSNARTFLPTQ